MSWVFLFQICDIAINWAGGLHHAKKFEVSEEVTGVTMAALGLVFKTTVGGSWVEELFLSLYKTTVSP